MKTIIVDGFKFTLSNGKNYHYNSTLRKHLHQYVWEKENGKIPEGYEVHHKDLNPLNNELDNLELLTIAEHKKLHAEISWDDERREWARNNLKNNALPKAIEWHKSDDGKEWHKKHYENTAHLLHVEKRFICECCGIKFNGINNGINRFCSNKCKSKWRRESGIDDITKTCTNCDSDFNVNKFSKTIYCSKSCAMKARHKNNKLKDMPN